MVLSVYTPHGGYNEEAHITELELMRTVMEARRMKRKDFLTGGDLDIDLKLENEGAGLECQETENLDWSGLFGPECKKVGECLGSYTKELRWLQLLRDFGSVVKCDTQKNFNTWQGLSQWRVRKQIDCITGPRNLRRTWFLNREGLRGWDHFSVAV